MAGPGLRERKKAETRARIVDEALRLFDERGFDGTTVADIAEAADISPRTFFGYFPTKEDVVFHDHDEFLSSFSARVRDREPGETAFDALRAWVFVLDAEGRFDEKDSVRRHRLIDASPSLAAHERANLNDMQQVLREAVAKDLGVELDSLRAHLVAAASTAALETLGRWDEGEEPGHRPPTDVLDEALVFLQGGLDALRRHPA